MRYCVQIQPNIIQHVFLGAFVFLTTLLSPVIIILTPIFAMLSLFQYLYNQVANLLGFDEIDLDSSEEGNQNFLDLLHSILVDIGVWIKGCGKGIPAIFVRDYIQNICDKCGLRQDTNIFTDTESPYYNLVYLPRTLVPSSRKRNEAFDIFWNYNSPLLNGREFLNDISSIFNFKWDIAENPGGPLLIFRRNTQNYGWPINANLLLDLNYSYNNLKSPAMAKFAYTPDPTDINGGLMIRNYNELVDFKDPPSNRNLVGITENIFNFSPPLFRKTEGSYDVISMWTEQSWISYTNNPFGAYFQATNLLLYITNADESQDGNEHFLLLANDVNYLPKLIVIDQFSPVNSTLPTQWQTGNDRWHYNVDMWFNDNKTYTFFDDQKPRNPNGTDYNGGGSNLYNRFWEQQIDPRLNTNIYGISFTGTMEYDLSILQDILQKSQKYGFVPTISLPAILKDGTEQLVSAKIEEIKITEGLIHISGSF